MTPSDTPFPSPDTEPRAAYTAGLRQVADWLDAHPEVAVPQSGSEWSPLSIVITGDADQRRTLAAIARVLPGKVAKTPMGNGLYTIQGQVGGLHVQVIAHRNEVCERVVTGTREVTKMVPAPDAPLVEVTETVEDVEWRCTPLLTEATS